MKRSAILAALLFTAACWQHVQAQKEIKVHEIMEYMSQGQQTGFEVAILDAEPKDVENTWERLMRKQGGKVSSSRKTVEIFTEAAEMPQVSGSPLNIYAIASKSSYGTRLVVFVDKGSGFISSSEHPESYAAFERFLKGYAHEEAIRVVEEELDEQLAILKDLNKDLENLIKDKDGFTKEIEKARALIQQREKEISQNIRSQETKRQQINIQEEIISTVRQKRVELGSR